MQALHLGPQGLRLIETDRPRPEAGEAIVKVAKTGICATDLELVKGYGGFCGVLGHEFVGVVDAAENGDWVGRRVVGSINAGCGRCRECSGAGPEHCPHRTVLGIYRRDGAFAEYLTLPVVNLLQVPEAVSDEVATFTEPLAAALRIRDQLAVAPSASSAVVGPGRLGLLAAQVLALSGTAVTVLGRREASLELPARLGLETGIAADAPDDAFDLVVEATGNAAGLAEALRLARPKGTVVAKSTYAEPAAVDLTKLVVGEVTVVGSRCGPFAPALQLLAAGAVEVRPLIEAEYPLHRGVEAFEHASRPGARKILLTPGPAPP